MSVTITEPRMAQIGEVVKFRYNSRERHGRIDSIGRWYIIVELFGDYEGEKFKTFRYAGITDFQVV